VLQWPILQSPLQQSLPKKQFIPVMWHPHDPITHIPVQQSDPKEQP
jgi:hypothetical protein